MELYHFGIKGMRWGVRRTPSQLWSTKPSWRTRREASRDAKEYARAKRSWYEATTAAKLRRGRRFRSRIVVGD